MNVYRQLFVSLLVVFYAFTLSYAQSPANIGGKNGSPKLLMWFIADSLNLVDGSPVSSWIDESGNSLDLSQPDNTEQPIYRVGVLNGHNGIYFNGNAGGAINYLGRAFTTDFFDDSVTIFAVYMLDEANINYAIISYNTTAQDNEFLLYYDFSFTNSLRLYANGGNVVSGLSAATSLTPYLLTVNWVNDGSYYFIYNGDELNFVSGTSTAIAGNIDADGFLAVGSDQDSYDGGYTVTQTLHGYLFELIIYSNKLNGAERSIIENYLSQKYGVSISTDRFGVAATYDPAYFNDFTGIGQSSYPAGYIQIGNSAGFIITADLGTLDNEEYAMFAHNGAPNKTTDIVTTGLPTGVQAAWNRTWYIEVTGTFAADIDFDFGEGLTDVNDRVPGDYRNYVLLYKASLTDPWTIAAYATGGRAEDRVYFALSNLKTGYYTLGTTDETNSPVEGTNSRTWYTLASGDWDDWRIWTLDPAGVLPNNPNQLTPSTSPTAPFDKVVILTGKNVTVTSNNKQNAVLEVYGTIDFTTTTGHRFDFIKGNGHIRLAADNFPDGDATDFVSPGQGEGTVIYYGDGYQLNTPRTFFNVIIDMTNKNKIVTLATDYTINGDLRIEKGVLKFNYEGSTTSYATTVYGDLVVLDSGFIKVANENIRDSLMLYGDLINYGVVKFTNRKAPDYANEATDGIVDVKFMNNKADQYVQCRDTTVFYRIVIEKGSPTYVLHIDAEDPNYFKLYGYASQAHTAVSQLLYNRNALGLITGTVRLGANVSVPVLNTTGNYNISENACLWVDGGYVAKSAGIAVVVYGKFKITNGRADIHVNSGFTLRDRGLIEVDGGYVDVYQIRTSVFGAGNVGGYIQRGGYVKLYGQFAATGIGYYTFSMTYPENVFIMSGGTLHVYGANGNAADEGGIFINSDPSNVSVTGGTVIAELGGTTFPFKITSRAPFYNLILRNTSGTNEDHILDAGTGVSSDGSVNLAAQPLVVLNDLTIEDNVLLNTNGQDLIVGGDFTISDNAQQSDFAFAAYGNRNRGLEYDGTDAHRYNLIFNGQSDQTFYIGYNTADDIRYELYVYNLIVDKPKDTRVLIQTNPAKDPTVVTREFYNRILHIDDTTLIISGILDQGRQAIRVFDYVEIRKNGQLGYYEHGTTPLTAYIITRDGTITIYTEKGAQIGNWKMNSVGSVTFTSDVYVHRIGYYNTPGGDIVLQNYNLKVDYLHVGATTSIPTVDYFSKDTLIYSNGLASDGGLSLFIPEGVADGTTFLFPIGVKGKYTPVEVTVSNVVDSGYIQIRPVDDELKLTNLAGGDLLNFYWRVSFEGFDEGKPTVVYKFHYDDVDVVGNEAGYVPGKVLDILPFTRSYEDGAADPEYANVDEVNNIITFNGPTDTGFELDSANYTAGAPDRFVGAPTVYYTNASYAFWSDNVWHEGSKTGPLSGTFPGPGDVAVIYSTADREGRIWADDNLTSIAALIFEVDRTVIADATTENIPRLQFYYVTNGRTFDLGQVRGTGMISRYASLDNITLLGDFGDYANDTCSVYMIWGSANQPVTLTQSFLIDEIPTLMLETADFTVTTELNINYDLVLNGQYVDVTPLANVYIGRNFLPGFWQGGRFHFNTTTPIEVVVKGNIDFTQANLDSYLNYERAIIVDDPGTAANVVHKLIVYGDIIQGTAARNRDYWTIDLYNGIDRPRVELILAGDTSAHYECANDLAVREFYRIIMDKGNDQSLFFEFRNGFKLFGPTDGAEKAIELRNGTLILNHPGIDVTLSSGGPDFVIPSTAALVLKGATARVFGNSTGIYLDGKLVIDNGGLLNMASGTGDGNNYIEYSASGNATIEIYDGSLLVGSQIRRGLYSDAGVLKYRQYGGVVQVGVTGAPENIRGIFEVINPGSEFTFTDGEFYIVNDYRPNPSIASFVFDPEVVNIPDTQVVNFGHSTTAATANSFTLFANKPLADIRVNNTSKTGVKLTLDVIALNLESDLIIDNGATFDANGLNITIKGNWLDTGLFVHNNNTVYFSGVNNQIIYGNNAFYDLEKNTANTLSILNDITVEHKLNLLNGIFDTKGKNVYCKGDVHSDITVLSSGNSFGIVMNGNDKQWITGNGTFARLMIDNLNGVYIPTGYTITITDSLLMKQGVFDIGKNLLVLTKEAEIIPVNAFSDINMIQTNISFTDAGVKKHFPLVTTADAPINFIYPIGSNGKYTPVQVRITEFEPDNAALRVKSADERHPSIIEDSESPDPEIVDSLNVLQYYWTLDAINVTKFTAEVTMQGKPEDVEVTPPYTAADYITARLLDRSLGYWDKYIPEDFNEATTELYFHFVGTDEAGIDGDYTAGVDGATFNGAIPDRVPIYVSVKDGLWTDKTTWSPESPAGGPKGAIVIIKHYVTVPRDFIVSYQTIIRATGTLDLGTTFGHRLGKVFGTGKIYLETGELPAGDYEGFFAPDSGTVEFGGTANLHILSEIPYVNNLILSGSGERNFPNLDLQIWGDLTITGTVTAINLYSKKISIAKNVVFDGGTFDWKSGTINFNGSIEQTVGGLQAFTGVSKFYNMEVSNTGNGVRLLQPVEVLNQLIFNSGIVNTKSALLTLLNSNTTDVVLGAGGNKFVEGPLQKVILSGQSFVFPVGDFNRYGAISISVVNANSGVNKWTVEYYNHSPDIDGYNIGNLTPDLVSVSDNEYWRILAPESGCSAKITLRWDASSGVPGSATERQQYLKVAHWNRGSSVWENIPASITKDLGITYGEITTTDYQPFNDDATIGNIYTLGLNYAEQIRWVGTVDTNWFNKNNWDGGRLPKTISDVIISASATYFPAITGIDTVKSILIESGATLKLYPGSALIITDRLENRGTFIMKAPTDNVSPYPSLVNFGELDNTNGIMKFELYTTAKEYHYVSSPLKIGNATSGLFTRRPNSSVFNPNFYKYNETVDLDGNPNTAPAGPYNSDHLVAGWEYAHNGATGTDVPLEIGKGYAYYDDISKLIVFEGTPNNGLISITGLPYTNNDPVSGTLPSFYDGWVLLGNPYPSYLNWNKVKQQIVNIDDAIYIWDVDQYAAYQNGIKAGKGTLDSLIPPYQGFFVHTYADNASINFMNEQRTYGSTPFFKKQNTKVSENKNIIQLSLNANGKKDIVAIYFDPNATLHFDRRLDAIKLMANTSYYPTVPNLFTYRNGISYSIDALPTSALRDTIVIGYAIGQNSNASITVEQINLPQGTKAYLIDSITADTIELTEATSYPFYANAGKYYRFKLIFSYNNMPVMNVNIADTSVYEDSYLTLNINPENITDPDGDKLSYEFYDLTLNQQADWIYTAIGEDQFYVVLAPKNENVGEHLIAFVAKDQFGGTDTIKFNVTVINVNDPPYVVAKLKDTFAILGKDFSYDLSIAFYDVDKNDKLTYDAYIIGENRLPGGLTIDQNSGVLYGIPNEQGDFTIKVVATDLAGDTVSTQFNLSIYVATTEADNTDVSIYPNPTDGVITITTNFENYSIVIIDEAGKVVYSKKISETRKELDLTQLSNGNYTVLIWNLVDGKLYVRKLIIY